MLEPKISINHKAFLLKNSKPYKTLLLLGRNYFQLAVIINQHIHVVREYNTENRNLTKTQLENILNLEVVQNAKKTILAIDSPKSVLVPRDLFVSANKEQYHKVAFDLHPTEHLLTNQIKRFDITDVFSIKKATENILKKALPKCTLWHSHAVLLQAYKDFISPSKKYSLFIYVKNDSVLFTLFDNKKLLLHNAFDITNNIDIHYHALNILKQKNISNNDSCFYIGGLQSSTEAIESLFSKDTVEVKPMSRIKSLQYVPSILETSPHSFFNLFSLALCAS